MESDHVPHDIVVRMNHACLKIGNSIFVAGGVTTDNFNQRLVTKKVERYHNKSTHLSEVEVKYDGEKNYKDKGSRMTCSILFE